MTNEIKKASFQYEDFVVSYEPPKTLYMGGGGGGGGGSGPAPPPKSGKGGKGGKGGTGGKGSGPVATISIRG